MGDVDRLPSQFVPASPTLPICTHRRTRHMASDRRWLRIEGRGAMDAVRQDAAPNGPWLGDIAFIAGREVSSREELCLAMSACESLSGRPTMGGEYVEMRLGC